MRPLIGISTYYVKDREWGEGRKRGFPGQDMLMSTMDYSRCVVLAGGIPVALPVIEDNSLYMDEIISRLDGLLFTGGPDIYPIRYNQHFKKGLGLVVPERDEFELEILERAINSGLPVFGICRGFQLINTLFGGSLHQDIKEEVKTNIEHVGLMAPKFSGCHTIRIVENSFIFKAFEKEELMVNSFHHQAISKIGEGLIETAWADDGIIEGFERKDSLVVGVQWHPEMMAEIQKEQLKIFQLFINKIKEKRRNCNG
ncbi:MAG: gamma-glutamyl-gamma-aminobutyrate hydrolase family protein [Clostridiales bacterium]|nr:gamma-glutamyl-gamma-aminobutyrate hydrolase family protein [Clostridiales bacterium]